MINLSETYIDNKNIFEIIENIQNLKITSSKTDILKMIDITLTLFSNNNDIFKIMNISFNTMELFNEFKFSTDNENCYITASLYDWITFIKTIITNWSYDSNLLSMFIIKISDFVNQEFNNYKLIHNTQSNINIYETYFNITNDLYLKFKDLCSKLNNIIGKASLTDNKLKINKYELQNLTDLNLIFYKINFNTNTVYTLDNNILLKLEKCN